MCGVAAAELVISVACQVMFERQHVSHMLALERDKQQEHQHVLLCKCIFEGWPSQVLW